MCGLPRRVSTPCSAQVAAARADYAPHLDASVNESVQRISPIGLPQNRTSGDPAGSATILQGEASWEIDFWGKYRRASEAGRAALLAGRAARQAVITSLVATVASSYFRMLALDEQLKIARETLAKQQAAAHLTLARLNGGVDSAIEMRAADARTADSEKLVLRLSQDVTMEENRICTLLGESPQSVPRGMSLTQQIVPDVGTGLPSTLLERRPDIREAEQNLIAANADIGVAKAAYFPNIGLTAGGGRESTALHNLASADAATWLLQPSLNVPIFAGGRIRARVRQAQAERMIRLTAYVDSVHQAFRDVSDALAYRDRAVGSERAQESITRYSVDAAALSAQRARAGVAGELELLRADQQRSQAQIDLAASRLMRLDATVQLYSALGGGWSESSY